MRVKLPRGAFGPRSLILYGSPAKATNAHKLVTTPRGIVPVTQPPYYVRAEVFNGSIEEALDAAGRGSRRQEGEIVLNTIPYPEDVEVFSPDGIPIREAPFASREEALTFAEQWLRRFDAQGGYKTAQGEWLHLADLQEALVYEMDGGAA